MSNVLLLLTERKATGPLVPLRQCYRKAIVEGLGRSGYVRVYETMDDGSRGILAIVTTDSTVNIAHRPNSKYAFAEIVENPEGNLVTVSLE